VIKPGCGGVPTFTYAKKLQFTLLLLALSSLLFALACLLRLCVRARMVSVSVASLPSDELDHELDELGDEDVATGTEDVAQVEGRPAAAPRVPSRRRRSALWKGLTPHQRRVMERSAHHSAIWLDFKHRLCHSLLILLSIFYLRLTTLLFKALLCDRMPDPATQADSSAAATESLYLREDGQTACWTGSHVGTAAVAIILLVVYSAGFPLFCFVLLTRAFTDETSTGAMGWLRRHIACLRGRLPRGMLSRLRRKAAGAQHAQISARPTTPSHSGWMQEPGSVAGVGVRYVRAVHDSSIAKGPTAPSTDELLLSAKLQRRRESATLTSYSCVA
jgi:hypothetical protein